MMKWMPFEKICGFSKYETCKYIQGNIYRHTMKPISRNIYHIKKKKKKCVNLTLVDTNISKLNFHQT